MQCYICETEFDYDNSGVTVQLVAAVQGPKSGRIMEEECPFPDGAMKRFVCSACFADSDIGYLLDLFVPGYDAPPQVIHGAV